MEVNQFFSNSANIYKVIDNSDDNFTVKCIKTNTIYKNNEFDYKQFAEQQITYYSFNDTLALYCDIISRTYPYLIVDIQGNIAGSKVSKKEYNEIRLELKNDTDKLVEFYNENIYLIASNNKELIDNDDRDILFLPKLYKDYVFSLHLHISTLDFHLEHLSDIFYSLDNHPNFIEFTKDSNTIL
jgi:hypothetical protein